MDAAVLTYSLEEIVAEKLRALLQQARMLDEHRWIRSRARDFNDLWRILRQFGESLVIGGFRRRLAEKCAVRAVEFEGVEDFLDARVLEHAATTWQDWLGHLVPDSPSFQLVAGELKIQLQLLLDGRD